MNDTLLIVLGVTAFAILFMVVFFFIAGGAMQLSPRSKRQVHKPTRVSRYWWRRDE